MFDLKGRNCLVTGGSGHLGRAMVGALAESGATVFAAGRDFGRVRVLADEFSQFDGEVIPLELDVTDDQSVSAAVESLGDLGCEELHALVNNAYSGPVGGIWDQKPEAYLEALDCSVGGAVRLLHALRPLLEVAGGNDGASIINVSSMYGVVSPDPKLYDDGFEAFHNPPAYGVAKAGLIQWTKYCAVHLAEAGIRSNALTPGPFPSELVQNTSPKFVNRLEGRVPLGRVGQPSDLSGIVVFLASGESRYMTGAVIPVDGGWTIQ